jgi:hypothetical protein
MEDASVKLAEIAKLLREREERSKEVQAIDERIAELAGATLRTQRKTKTFTAKDFARGCGL